MMRAARAPVLALRRLANDHFLLAVQAGEIARTCRPGQFVMVAGDDGMQVPSPLLKRALAVYSTRFESSREAVTLLFKVIGDGTRRLASLHEGDRVNLIGPLGNGFDAREAAGRTTVLVAGGIGIASFLLLAENLQSSGEAVSLVFGGRTQHDLVGLEDFRRIGIPVQVTTDDGSLGIHGLVTDGLEKALQGARNGDPIVLACGPTPMMRAVARMAAERRIPCRISVENRMACGFGVCLGCTVKLRQGYRLACTHGPVFDAEAFVWVSDDRRSSPPEGGQGPGPTTAPSQACS